jgi:hypothetical protein
MTVRVVVYRVLRIVAISFLVLLLTGFAFLEYQRHLIRSRSERLLADFHSICLNQTTWPEAQALMKYWGKQGHPHGTCSSTDCAYDITVVGWPSLLPSRAADSWLFRFGGRFPIVLQFVGMRFSILDFRFLVEDGAVRRTRLSLTAETEDEGYISALLITARSDAALNRSEEAPDEVGADEELGVHPDFIVGPRGFCTGCETVSLDYTAQIAPDELVRLTSFRLSCLTRMLPCLHLAALAPALMREDTAIRRDVPRNSVPCTTPAWALARDAKAIWLIDALDTSQVLDPNPIPGETPAVIEQDRIRVVRVLKGPPRILPQTTIQFRPYSGVEYEARAVPEHLIPGHRYIVLPYTNSDVLKDGAEAWRCGVIDDTQANEQSINQGIAMEDHLRAPELTGAWPW